MKDSLETPADPSANRLQIWDRLGVLFLLAMTALSVFGLMRIKTNTEDVLQWLPDQSQSRTEYDFFKRNFDSDDFVILTWPDCTTEDQRLRDFASKVREYDPDQLVARVTTGYDITRELGEKLEISRRAIINRMAGVFFGIENRELTCALVELSHDGTKRRSDAMKLIESAVEQVEGLHRDDISMAGYPYIATYIDQQLHGSYKTLLLPSIILATIISFLCLRDFLLGAIVFITATGAATVSVAIAPAFGVMLGGLMSIIPALVFVLATSGSIHLMRYSLDAIGDPFKLLSIGWRPCVISTLTTAVGMLSLTRSEFPAIRNFGLFCAIGVGFALAFQLVMVPWLLTRLGQNGLKRLAARNDSSTFWAKLAHGIFQLRWTVTLLFFGLIAAGVAGLMSLRAEVEVEKLFRADSSIIQSLTELESTLAPMDQTEVLLIFSDPKGNRMFERAAFARAVQSEIGKVDSVSTAYSLANFLPRDPKIKRARDVAKRSTMRDYLDRERASFADGGMLAIDSQTGAEIWRISVRFPFTEQVDFERLRDEIQQATTRVAAQFQSGEGMPTNSSDSFAAPSFIYTGHTYLFHHAQLSLLKDLFFNFLLAFAIITPLLIVVLRSLRIGLIAMIPNVFPTVVVFGMLGWLSHPIDLALAMTACVALGIAVDDTTHFLIRFRDYGGSLSQVDGPIQKTLAQCGPAMLHTTLIASASLMTYYFSNMLVVSRFSWAISLLLAVALVADVLMLPAIMFVFGRSDLKT
ncbi:MAG: MMPL family transporter [Planctomycetota bacterium]